MLASRFWYNPSKKASKLLTALQSNVLLNRSNIIFHFNIFRHPDGTEFKIIPGKTYLQGHLSCLCDFEVSYSACFHQLKTFSWLRKSSLTSVGLFYAVWRILILEIGGLIIKTEKWSLWIIISLNEMKWEENY